nr:MAG TPA: hypothetical protein [Caudoviricetes sp.]
MITQIGVASYLNRKVFVRDSVLARSSLLRLAGMRLKL